MASQPPVISLIRPIDNKVLKCHLLENTANYNKWLTECEHCTFCNRLQHLERRLLNPHSDGFQINHDRLRSHKSIPTLIKASYAIRFQCSGSSTRLPPALFRRPQYLWHYISCIIYCTRARTITAAERRGSDTNAPDKPCLSFIGAHADLLSRGRRRISGANVCL